MILKIKFLISPFENHHCVDCDVFFHTNAAKLSHNSSRHGKAKKKSTSDATPRLILKQRKLEFLCEMSDGTVQWIAIDDVVNVPSAQGPEAPEDIPTVTDHLEFVRSPWQDVPEDEDFDEEL